MIRSDFKTKLVAAGVVTTDEEFDAFMVQLKQMSESFSFQEMTEIIALVVRS